jgi:spermidine synthase
MPSLGQEIYRTQDPEGSITLYQNGVRRVLTFGNSVEQSCICLQEPARLEYTYTQAMFLATLLGGPPRQALVLGLGGGSLVRALHARYPRCHITAVEARLRVVEVARDYFALPEDPHLELVVADAATYVAKTRLPPQDLIFIDLYLAEALSPLQTDRVFLQACRGRLARQGLVSINLWCSDQEAALRTSSLLQQIMDGQVLSLQVQGGNLVLFGFAAGLPSLERRRFFNQAHALGVEMDIPLQRLARNLWRQNAEVLAVGRFRNIATGGGRRRQP